LGSGSGGGGGCFSTTGPSCTFKDQNAFVDFNSVSACSDTGYIFTDATVQIFESFTNPGRASSQAVQVSFSVYNSCTNTEVESASNIDPSTFLADFNGTLTFSKDLSSATVNGTAPLFDNFTGAPLGTATIALTWTGYGPEFTFSSTNHARGAGFLMNSHSSGTSRSAVVSGQLIDPSNTNFAANPTINADLSNSKGGTVQFSKS
jgi:hypothetical protein